MYWYDEMIYYFHPPNRFHGATRSKSIRIAHIYPTKGPTMASNQLTDRRRVLRGLAVAATLPTILARPAWSQANPVKISFGWPFANGTQGIEELAKRFSEEKRTIQVEVQVIPQAQVLPRLTTAFTGGQAPDCLGMSDAWLAQFAGGGWLSDLEDLISASGIEKELVPASMQLARLYKGRAYYAGFVVEPYAVYYNKKHYAEAGISQAPRDVDEFRNTAIKLTNRARNRYGYYAMGGSGWQFQQWSTWMVNHGGLGVANTMYDAQGKCVLASAKHIEGLEKWLALYQVDKVSPPASATGTFQDQTNAFNAGQIGTVMGWGQYLSTLANGIGEENLGTALPPMGPAGQFFFYGGNGFGINKNTAHREACWEFIRFMLRADNNARWNQTGGAIPTARQAWSADWLKAPKYVAPMEMINRANALINNPRYLPGYGSFQTQFAPEQIQRTLLGRQTAAEHAKAVANALDELRAKAG